MICCSCVICEVVLGLFGGIREAIKQMVVQTIMGTVEHFSSGMYWA